MKSLLNPISQEFAYSMGWTLLHSLWQGTALVLIVAVLLFLFKERSAKLRYSVSLFFVAFQLFVSVLTFLYYYWQVTSEVMLVSSPVPSGSIMYSGIAPELSAYQKVVVWFNLHFTEIVFCWLVGAGVLALRFTGSWVFLKRLRYSSVPVKNPILVAKFEELLNRLDITQRVDFRETSRILSPMVIGVTRPLVLVPVGMFIGFTTSQIEAVLAHELAHIRRYDYLVNLLQSLIEIVFFFHPAIWWLSARINTERENCCDDLALTVCEDRMALAHALVKVAEQQLSFPLAMALNSNKNVLMNRVRRVVGLAPASNRSFNLVPSVLLLVGLLAGVSVYALDQKEEQKSEKKKQEIEVDTTTKRAVITLTQRKDSVLACEVKELAASVPDSGLAPINIELRQKLTLMADSIKVAVDDLKLAEMPFNLTFRATSGNNPSNEEFAAIIRDHEVQVVQGMKVSAKQQEELEKLKLEIEQQTFERDRLTREREKLNWQKKKLAESRATAIREQSRLFSEDKKTVALNEKEREKQLELLEQKISQDEQQMTKLSSAISNLVLADINIKRRIQTIEKELRGTNFNATTLFRAEPAIIVGNPVPGVPVAPEAISIPPRPTEPSTIKVKPAKAK